MSRIRKYFVISMVSSCLIFHAAAYTAQDFIKVATFNIASVEPGKNSVSIMEVKNEN